ncbi:N-formimino-L-glutamate deiminase [compost metagenome]
MIRRQCAIFCRKRCAMQIGKLVGMQLDRQTVGFCSLKHQPHLISRKSNTFTETVNRIGQAFRRYGGHHLVDDFVDVTCLVALEFRRQSVSA